jgi:hypothetical protein
MDATSSLSSTSTSSSSSALSTLPSKIETSFANTSQSTYTTSLDADDWDVTDANTETKNGSGWEEEDANEEKSTKPQTLSRGEEQKESKTCLKQESTSNTAHETQKTMDVKRGDTHTDSSSTVSGWEESELTRVDVPRYDRHHQHEQATRHVVLFACIHVLPVVAGHLDKSIPVLTHAFIVTCV